MGSLWKSKLGPRYLLGGTHPDIWLGSSSEVLMWTGALDICRSTSHASYKVCHHTLVDQEPQSLSCRGIQGVANFFKAEELGVGQPRRCDTCKHCVRCSYRAEYMTKVEAAKLAMLEQNVTVDLANKRVSMRYPTKGDLSQFREYQGQAIGCAASLERRLIWNKTRHLYNTEFKGYVERGVFKELTKHKMESWEGPVNYIYHHGVPKPSSVTTALRLVSNSSLKNTQSGGISYNDFLVKGPNSLQPLLQVIADFRTLPNVVSWDYAKAYNTVYTFPEEMHMRRLVWRYAEDEPWRIFGIDRMHFGDRPAATGLEVAKKKVAELGKQVDEQTADIITRGYVDDGFGGGPEYVVQKLIGVESFCPLEEEINTTQTLSFRGIQGEEQTLTFRGKQGDDKGSCPTGLAGRSPSRTLPDKETNTENEGLDMEIVLLKLNPGVNNVITEDKIKEVFKNVSSIEFVTQFPVTDTIVTMSTTDAASKAILDPLTDLPPITVKFELVPQHLVQAEVDWDKPLKGDLRGDLMKLRFKDLQHFLTRKKINISQFTNAENVEELDSVVDS